MHLKKIIGEIFLFSFIFSVMIIPSLPPAVLSAETGTLPSLETLENLHPNVDKLGRMDSRYTWTGSIGKKQSREYTVKAWNNMILRRTVSSWKATPTSVNTSAVFKVSVGIEIQAANDVTKVLENHRKTFEENPRYEKFRKEPFGERGFRYRRTSKQGYSGPTTTLQFTKGNTFVQVTAYSDHAFLHDEMARKIARIILAEIK